MEHSGVSILRSDYFGSMQYAPGSVFELPQGLPGFESERRFAAIEIPSQRPLLYLQSLNRASLCLLTLPVRALAPDYELRFSPEDLDILGLPAGSHPRIGEQILCLALLAVDEHGEPTANLYAPLVVNLSNFRCLQVIQFDTDWSLRHPLPFPQSAPC